MRLHKRRDFRGHAFSDIRVAAKLRGGYSLLGKSEFVGAVFFISE